MFRRAPPLFYDVNAKITQQLGDGSNLSVGYYRSFDNFRYAQFFGFRWGIQTVNLQWNQILTDWLSSNTTIVYGDNENISFDPDGLDAFELRAGQQYYKGKQNFFFNLFDNHEVHFGVEYLLLNSDPETLKPDGSDSGVIPASVSKDRGDELAFYINDEIILSPRLSLSAGLRYVIYRQLGPEKSIHIRRRELWGSGRNNRYAFLWSE